MNRRSDVCARSRGAKGPLLVSAEESLLRSLRPLLRKKVEDPKAFHSRENEPAERSLFLRELWRA